MGVVGPGGGEKLSPSPPGPGSLKDRRKSSWLRLGTGLLCHPREGPEWGFHGAGRGDCQQCGGPWTDPGLPGRRALGALPTGSASSSRGCWDLSIIILPTLHFPRRKRAGKGAGAGRQAPRPSRAQSSPAHPPRWLPWRGAAEPASPEARRAPGMQGLLVWATSVGAEELNWSQGQGATGQLTLLREGVSSPSEGASKQGWLWGGSHGTQ